MLNRIDEMTKAWQSLQTLAENSRPARRTNARDNTALEALPPPKFIQYPPLLPTSGMLAGARASSSARSSAQPVQPDGTETEESESSTETSSTPTLSPRRSPVSTAKHPGSSASVVIRLPDLPTDDHSGGSAGSAPVTPRSEKAAGSGHRGKLKKLRKKASKQLIKVATEFTEMVQKLSPRSERRSAEKLSPGRKASPTKDNPLLAGIPVAERNKIAVEMAILCQQSDYQEATPARQSMMFNAKLMELLPDHQESTSQEVLKALRKDLEWRMKNAVVDMTVDLADPRFSDFVSRAEESAFAKPWKNDASDTTDGQGKPKKNADKLQPTFIRDFDNSDYFFVDADREPEKLTTTDRFIEWVGRGEDDPLPRFVSNFASQNLGNFLKNVLFLRQNRDGQSKSVIRLYDGTPVMPLAIAKASYVFSKTPDGDLVLDYEWKSSTEMNGNKPLRVKKMSGDLTTLPVSDASLRITVRMIITEGGKWHIGNPRLQAQGWNVPLEEQEGS